MPTRRTPDTLTNKALRSQKRALTTLKAAAALHFSHMPFSLIEYQFQM